MFQYITLVHHLKLYNISFFSLNSLENQLYFYMNELNIEIRSGAIPVFDKQRRELSIL